MYFFCSSTPIVSIIFLIELSLFCFLDQYLVMVLAGANFMFQLHNPYIESRCVPLRRIKLSCAWFILNPLTLLMSRFFFCPAMHHNLLFHFHHMNFFVLSYSSDSEQAFMQSKHQCLSFLLLLLTIEPGALFRDVGGDKALDANQSLYTGDTAFL